MNYLTETQETVLNFCRAHLDEHQMPPTRAEIAAHFNWASANAAEDHLKALVRKGAIALVPGKSRGIKLLDPR